MSRWIRRRSIVGGIAGAFLALVVSLSLVFDAETNTDDVIGVPLDATSKASLQGTHLAFIGESGRVVVNEHGTRQIIWETPQLPTLEESISKAAEAAEARDIGLLPLCTQEYLQYLKVQGASGEPSNSLMTDSKAPSFPSCNAIPDKVAFGPPGKAHKAALGSPSRLAPSTSNPDHTGYFYHGASVDRGINGAISRDNPSLNSGEFVTARLLAGRYWSGNAYWLEGGWTENYDAFNDHDQHVYTQQCDTTQSSCMWISFESVCGDNNNTLVYIDAHSDDNWYSFCWNFDHGNWVTMWSASDLGDDHAHFLEAFFETSEDQAGTISMGTVNFYGLELKSNNWTDWTATYDDDTTKKEEGAYTVTTNTSFHDFDVDN